MVLLLVPLQTVLPLRSLRVLLPFQHLQTLHNHRQLLFHLSLVHHLPRRFRALW